MIQKRIDFVVFAIFWSTVFLFGCQSNPKSPAVKLPAVEVSGVQDDARVPKRPLWRLSESVTDDIVHMDLEIEPNWERKQVIGKAHLFVSPHLKSLNKVFIEGKGMIVKSIRRKDVGGEEIPLSFDYDDYMMEIELDRLFARTDTFELIIEYIARPTELHIHCPKLDPYGQGMFFVEPGKFTPTKPKQIWTQGEPEDASVWFPTNDSPNERFTHSLTVELPKGMTSLSNGQLVSVEAVPGKETEKHRWVMDKPHAPYLVMLAAGDFVVEKDSWKGMDVHYYVEKDYREDARRIFGRTPDMLDFFSQLLDYPYPWNKYHQICVRDYTSGAMENTTAVVFGEFVQKKETESLGKNHELIVAHELFHHWFGDLVTCESWAQIPLNEAFANYSEYLWLEHAYGKDIADQHNLEEALGYFGEYEGGKQEDLIRYDYRTKEDMFDAHSYNKGGRILHMLREVMGDTAFFGGLSLYLKQHAYQPVEVHHLRMALEAYAGRDLSWFFNQWFLDAGHMVLEINQGWIEDKKIQFMVVNQKQNLEFSPIYAMPADVDFYFEDTTIRYSMVIDAVADTFVFEFDSKPLLVNFDATKTLLCEKSDLKTVEQFTYQFRHAPLFMDKWEALNALNNAELAESVLTTIINMGFESDFYKIRARCAEICGEKDFRWAEQSIKRLLKDPHPEVREAAMVSLSEILEPKTWMSEAEQLWKEDAALSVRLAAFESIYAADSLRGYALALERKDSPYSEEIAAISAVFAVQGDASFEQWFRDSYTRLNESNAESDYVIHFGVFLAKQDLDMQRRNMDFFEEVLRRDPMWIARLGGYFGVIQLLEALGDPEEGEAAEVYNSYLDMLREYLGRERNSDILKYF